jgi:hypothetical protein
LALNGLHGVISQEIVFLITTAVRTSNPTYLEQFITFHNTNFIPAMKEDVWASGGIAPPSLTSTLVGGEWSCSGSARFTSVEMPPVPIGPKAEWAPEPVRMP